MLPLFQKKQKADNCSTNEQKKKFDTYIEEFKLEVIQLINDTRFEKCSGEPLAPWICYHYPLRIDPEEMKRSGIEHLLYAERDSFYWYTLDAKTYMKKFIEFFSGKTVEERKRYFIKYDLGPKWRDRESWFNELFDPDGITDQQYDTIYDEIFKNKRD